MANFLTSLKSLLKHYFLTNRIGLSPILTSYLKLQLPWELPVLLILFYFCPEHISLLKIPHHLHIYYVSCLSCVSPARILIQWVQGFLYVCLGFGIFCSLLCSEHLEHCWHIADGQEIFVDQMSKWMDKIVKEKDFPLVW